MWDSVMVIALLIIFTSAGLFWRISLQEFAFYFKFLPLKDIELNICCMKFFWLVFKHIMYKLKMVIGFIGY